MPRASLRHPKPTTGGLLTIRNIALIERPMTSARAIVLTWRSRHDPGCAAQQQQRPLSRRVSIVGDKGSAGRSSCLARTERRTSPRLISHLATSHIFAVTGPSRLRVRFGTDSTMTPTGAAETHAPQQRRLRAGFRLSVAVLNIQDVGVQAAGGSTLASSAGSEGSGRHCGASLRGSEG
jgi:hypothetical protein